MSQGLPADTETDCSRTRRVRACALLCTALALIAPRALGATPDDAVAHGLAFAEEAADAYKSGNFEQAIELYQRAQRENPDPITLHNIGRCYEAIGSRKLGDIEPARAAPAVLSAAAKDLSTAVDHYKRFLEAEPNASNRAVVEQRIRALSAQTKLLEELSAKPIEPKPEARDDGPRISAPWIIAGIGGATLTTGIALAVLARENEQQSNDPATSGEETIAAAERATTFATAANVLFGVGAAISIAGATWGVIDLATRSGAKTPSAKITIGPGWLGVVGNF